MPCDAICSFGSYLDQSTGNYFTKPRENKFIKKCNDTGFIDKIAKTLDPIFDGVDVIAKWYDASDETLKGIHKGREVVKVSRDFMGMFNIFNGAIPALYQNIRHISLLVHNMFFKSEAYSFKENPAKYNEVAITVWEKIAALFEQIGKAVGAGSFIVGFGVCRPIANFEKHISKNIDATASKVGKTFPTIMMVNHVGGVVGSSAGLIFNSLAYTRNDALNKVGTVELGRDAKVYHDKIVDNCVGLAQKSLELVCDILHHTGTTTPAWARIPLNFTIGCLSITKEWLKPF